MVRLTKNPRGKAMKRRVRYVDAELIPNGSHWAICRGMAQLTFCIGHSVTDLPEAERARSLALAWQAAREVDDVSEGFSEYVVEYVDPFKMWKHWDMVADGDRLTFRINRASVKMPERVRARLLEDAWEGWRRAEVRRASEVGDRSSAV